MKHKHIELLKEFASLERPTFCFQVVLLLNLCERGYAPSEISSFEYNGNAYFEGKSIREQLGGITVRSNLHKANYALLESGFVERLVTDQEGNVILHDSYSKKFSTLYWRLTDKARVLLALS